MSMVVDFTKLKVLIVDDEKYAIKLLTMILKDLGTTQVFSAPDATSALKFLDDCEDLINVIISDWNMPGMTGLELLRQVREKNRDIAFVMMTGNATMEAVKQARDAGVTDYIAKPFSPDRLERKLLHILTRLKTAA